MITYHPPEILLAHGSLQIHTYGVILALAIMIALSWASNRAQIMNLDRRLADDVFFWAIIGAILGARIGFVLQEPGLLSQPQHLLAVWEGGLSFHGGLIGALIAGWLVLKNHKATNKFWQIADAASLPLLLGAAIGRLGNWANQELYGYPTNLPWAITIDPTHRLPGYESLMSFHPTFAYELLLNLLGIALLILLIERMRTLSFGFSNLDFSRAGTSFLLVLVWYSIARGVTEIWRISDRLIGPFSLAQVISISMVLICFWLLNQRKA